MIDAYLAACKAASERPNQELAAALGGDDGDSCFKLSGMALVRALLERARRTLGAASAAGALAAATAAAAAAAGGGDVAAAHRGSCTHASLASHAPPAVACAE